MPHILLIEDNEHQRRIMRERLQTEGFQVTDTPYGDEGVLLAKNQRPDLIIIDIMVPHMNGWEVMSALQADASTKDIPFVVLSGAKTLPQDIERSMAMGSQAHFAKGISPMDDMLREIRLILGIKKVLIVDADSQRASALRDVLQKNHYLASILAVGAEAVNRLPRIRPDLIIMSQEVGGISPIVVLQRIRQTPGLGHLPFVLIGQGAPPSLPGRMTGILKMLPFPCPEREVVGVVESVWG